jgi:hypothetical protein
MVSLPLLGLKGGKTSSACVVRRVGYENYVRTSIRAIIVDLIAAATNVHFTRFC